jgi:hypothetical protein
LHYGERSGLPPAIEATAKIVDLAAEPPKFLFDPTQTLIRPFSLVFGAVPALALLALAQVAFQLVGFAVHVVADLGEARRLDPFGRLVE